MSTNDDNLSTPAEPTNPARKRGLLAAAALGVSGVLAGAIMAASLSATAADNAGSQPSVSQRDHAKPTRSDEKLLTGSTKAKVEAAVKAKYPNASIERTETDSDGVYESHVVLDGKPTIVQVGKDFAVTGTDTMPAPPPGAPAAQPGSANAA